MRNSFKTWVVAGIVCTAAVAAGTSIRALGDDDDSAETAKLAKEALDKSIARGKELFKSKDLGKKSCAACHEDPEKPNLNLATRVYSNPPYSSRKRDVVSMAQRINEMLVGKSKGKEMELGSADLVALEAYVVSIKAK